MKRATEWIRDRFWPSLEGPTGVPQKVPAAFFPQGSPVATEVLASLKEQEQVEEERKRVADQKLQGMLQFASISVTILLAVAAFLADQKYRGFSRLPLTIVVCVAAYVSLQCLRAAIAAVIGLERKEFERLTLDEVSWQADEDLSGYQHRMARVRARCLALNAEVINEKVSWMAVGHAAIKNALAMLVIAIYVLTLVAVYHAWSEHS